MLFRIFSLKLIKETPCGHQPVNSNFEFYHPPLLNDLNNLVLVISSCSSREAGRGFEEVCQLDRMAVFEGPSRDITYKIIDDDDDHQS